MTAFEEAEQVELKEIRAARESGNPDKLADRVADTTVWYCGFLSTREIGMERFSGAMRRILEAAGW